MALNSDPRFVSVPNISLAANIPASSTVNAAADGTGTLGTNIFSLFTAGSNGSFVAGIGIKALSTNTPTVVRFFANNGSAPGTATTQFLAEYSLPTITASSTVANPVFYLPLNIALSAGWRILACYPTTVTSALYFPITGWDF